jgi:hypothetical protein
MKFIVLISLLLVSCAHKPAAEKPQVSIVDQAVSAAQILATDTLEEKVQKTLKLINQARYYYPKGRTKPLGPPFDNPYHLESMRTAEQILEQKVGGFSANAALVFSAMLMKAGVKSDDLQIVATVNAPDLETICPAAHRPRSENPDTGADGHVFVAVKFSPDEWRLINTIDGPNYESVTWVAPKILARKMRRGPVQIPYSVYKKFGPAFNSIPLVVFRSWAPDQVPLHTFDQRLDLIASGNIAVGNHPKDKNKICRYGAAEMKALERK